MKAMPTWKPKKKSEGSSKVSLRVDAMGDVKHAGLGGIVSVDGFDKGAEPGWNETSWFRYAWEMGNAPVEELDEKQPRRIVAALEALALLVGLRILLRKGGEEVRHRMILAETDSMVCALASESWGTRSPLLQRIFKEIAIECILNDVCFQAIHIPGERNVVADGLSRMTWHPRFAEVVKDLIPDNKVNVHLNSSMWLQNTRWLQ